MGKGFYSVPVNQNASNRVVLELYMKRNALYCHFLRSRLGLFQQHLVHGTCCAVTQACPNTVPHVSALLPPEPGPGLCWDKWAAGGGGGVLMVFGSVCGSWWPTNMAGD